MSARRIVLRTDIPSALAALDAPVGSDPLAAVRDWFGAHGHRDPGTRLKARGVPVEFFSRIGD